MAVKMASPLGKGLKALLPVSAEEGEAGFDHQGKRGSSEYFQCPIDFILPNPYQPRKEMVEEALENLADSIKEKGVLQPLVVRKIDQNKFELIAGERRLRASKLAGLEKVPVLVREIAISDRLELALIENIQRENLNAIEEAEAYEKLKDEFALTQDVIAKRVGKNRSTIANSMRLLQLPKEVKDDIAANRLSSGHARVLIGFVEDQNTLMELRNEIVEKALSVREAEVLARKAKSKEHGKNTGSRKKANPAILPQSYCQSLENGLVNYLGSKSRIVQNGSRGKIEIEYYSPDDLERLLSLIVKE